jgi:hypothetical protein
LQVSSAAKAAANAATAKVSVIIFMMNPEFVSFVFYRNRFAASTRPTAPCVEKK